MKCLNHSRCHMRAQIQDENALYKTITTAFSEQDIIDLQDKLLTNGFQFIKVDHIGCGRIIMETFLQALNCYNNVACLTMEKIPFQFDVFDVYQELQTQEHLTIDDAYLVEFFLEKFYIDFLWIEATDQLIAQSWFEHFEHIIMQMNIEKTIPIFVLSYGTNSHLR